MPFSSTVRSVPRSSPASSERPLLLIQVLEAVGPLSRRVSGTGRRTKVPEEQHVIRRSAWRRPLLLQIKKTYGRNPHKAKPNDR